MPMLRWSGTLLLTMLGAGAAVAQPLPIQSRPYPMPQMVVVAPVQTQSHSNLGGGFVEFLFGERPPQPQINPPPLPTDRSGRPIYANADPYVGTQRETPPAAAPRVDIDPRYMRQEVEYRTTEEPGTVVIDTDNKFLYLVEPDGKAMRYGIGVGRPGFTWAGTHKVTAKREWPDWHPPKEMLERQPYLPHHMAGGPHNPLGARALYLGSTLYRIHGTNEDWTIGTNVSSGCIRLRNADVVDLYERVPVGAKVVVM
jgi:lipoprotein-anchoring transpeptidase ErfK/SrfK